jgi:hypothetical protein
VFLVFLVFCGVLWCMEGFSDRRRGSCLGWD